MKDLAAEMVALSTRQEEPAEVESTGNSLFQRMMWFLSAGYSISTPMGVIRLNAKGNLRKSELLSAPDRSRILLDLSLSMSAEMRRMLNEVELDVEIQQSATGPVLIGITSGFNAKNPERAAKGEGVPITPGQPCVIRGKRIKVGGEGPTIGVTITRQDGDSGETHTFTATQLFPNTATRVGFVLPPTVEDGSIWSVKLCTQLGSNGSQLLKEPREAVLDDVFVVGENITGGGEEEEENPSEI